MKKLIGFICIALIIVFTSSQIGKLPIMSSQAMDDHSGNSYAQDLNQISTENELGNEDLLYHNLWVDVLLETTFCSSEYRVIIQYQNRGTEDATDARIVFYAPNYPSANLYTSLIKDSMSPPGAPTGDPLSTIEWTLPNPFPANGPIDNISFRLCIVNLDECKSLSHIAAIYSNEFSTSHATEDLYICPPDLVSSFITSQTILPIGITHELNALVTNVDGLNITTSFEVCFYEGDPKTSTPFSCETISALNCWESKTVPVSWSCPDIGTYTLYVSADPAPGVVNELDETNNNDSITITCVDTVEGCDLLVSKVATTSSTFRWQDDILQCVHEGEKITYDISVLNFGIESCNNVRIVDTLPIELDETTAQVPDGLVSDATITWNRANILSGSTANFSFDINVRSGISHFTPIINCVTVECENDLNSLNNTFCDTIYVCPSDTCDKALCPILSVRSTGKRGDTVIFEVLPFTFINSGTLTVIPPLGNTISIFLDPVNLFPYQTKTYSLIDTDLCGKYTVRLNSTYTIDITTCACEDSQPFIVDCEPTFHLDRNFVLPANDQVVAIFFLLKNSHVTIDIYNIAGESIRDNFVNGDYSPGPSGTKYEVPWDLKNDDGELVSSGVYYFVMEAGPINEFRQVAVIR